MATTAVTKLKTKDGFYPSILNYLEIQKVKGFVLMEPIDPSHAGADMNNKSLSSDEDMFIASVMVSNKLGHRWWW